MLIMKSRNNKIIALLINDYHRTKGSGTFGEKSVDWDEADFILVITIEDKKGEVFKYRIAPKSTPMVLAELADVSWGTLVELTIRGKEVVDVKVLVDWMDEYFNASSTGEL